MSCCAWINAYGVEWRHVCNAAQCLVQLLALALRAAHRRIIFLGVLVRQVFAYSPRYACSVPPRRSGLLKLKGCGDACVLAVRCSWIEALRALAADPTFAVASCLNG